MPQSTRHIEKSDVLPWDVYARSRKDVRAKLIAVKKNRRVEVGPYATFYFENYDTMWQQVQEMVHIEKGGDEQIAGELEVYNPLIPQGNELIATMMIEVDDPIRRVSILHRLAGIEETVYLELAGQRIKASPTDYEDRTTPDGKTSSVHWVRIVLTPEQIALFKKPETQIILGIGHENYGHMALLAPAVKAELAKDFA